MEGQRHRTFDVHKAQLRRDFNPPLGLNIIIASMQLLICLVGIPGSGKTTFAKQVLCHAAWAWINQDTLGDKEACRFAAHRALSEGKNVIIDRSVCE